LVGHHPLGSPGKEAVVLKGFKDFLMRGNVVELAVAVVIGVAFNAVVTAFTQNLINPIIASFGGANINGLGFQLVGGNPKTVIDVGAMLSALINFVLVAAVLYFLFVLPYQLIEARRKRGQETGPAEPTDVELLTEIRDLLASQQHRPPAPNPPTAPTR
jgi:large conductance mechanosensitive channel